MSFLVHTDSNRAEKPSLECWLYFRLKIRLARKTELDDLQPYPDRPENLKPGPGARFPNPECPRLYLYKGIGYLLGFRFRFYVFDRVKIATFLKLPLSFRFMVWKQKGIYLWYSHLKIHCDKCGLENSEGADRQSLLILHTH